jgi:threonine synthase
MRKYWQAYWILGGQEGVFCEPASAASVAGLLKVHQQVPDGATVVCVLTGNGLKDPDSAVKHSNNQLKSGDCARINPSGSNYGLLS